MFSHSAPISKQISAISTSLLGGLFLLAVGAVATTLVLRATFVDYRATARATIATNLVLEDIFAARLAALKWRLNPSAEAEDDLRGNVQRVLGADVSDLDLAGLGFDVEATLDRVVAEMDIYQARFDDLVAARAAFNAAEATAMEAGELARRALAEIMATAFADERFDLAAEAGQTQQSIMQARYYLERFGRTEAVSDLDRSVTEIKDAMVALEMIAGSMEDGGGLALAATAEAHMDALIEKKAALLDTLNAEIAARNDMDEVGPQVVAALESLVDAVVARQNTLGPRGQLTSFWAVLAIAVFATLIIAFGWRLSSRISHRIASDITNSVATMSRIAEGDLGAVVNGAEKDNEFGDMARALDVFKANGKAAIEAAERERIVEEERVRDAAERKEQQDERDARQRQEAEAARKAMIDDLNSSLGKVVSAASKGDFSKRVDAAFADQQLAALGDEVNVLVETVETGLSETGSVLAKVAAGDLTQSMTGEFHGAFKELQSNTNDMISSLRKLLSEISHSSGNLSLSSRELKDTSSDLARRAEQNAASLATTSAALEELTSSITQVSQNVDDANENAEVARKTADASSSVASDAAEAMQEISKASGDIGRVVGVIDEISFQINLLALNAGVEAARAGDAGRGFSVVASEVRQLAQRAGSSAKEISEVIARSEAAVNVGVTRVSDAKTSLDEIATSIVQVFNGINQVSKAIGEQVNGISEISDAVSQVDQNTQKQTASFEEITAASAVLATEAETLGTSTGRFKTGQSKLAIVKEKATIMVEEEKKAPSAPPLATMGNLALDDGDWTDF
ncbi:MAG: methyl-accepting chemotaxis protein [Pseudomonadota bacterium]